MIQTFGQNETPRNDPTSCHVLPTGTAATGSNAHITFSAPSAIATPATTVRYITCVSIYVSSLVAKATTVAVCVREVCAFLYFFGRMTKRGTPPKTLTKRGTLLFVDREVFDVHVVVVGINPTAQQDVCASTVHYSSYIHHHYSCMRTAKCPTA